MLPYPLLRWLLCLRPRHAPIRFFLPAPAPWNAALEAAPVPLLASVADRQYAKGKYATAAVYFQQARLKAPALGRYWLQEGFALTFCRAESDLSQWRASLSRSPLAEEVQSGIVHKVTGAGLGNAPCQRLEVLPEHFLAEELLTLGEALVGKKNFPAAAPILRWARKHDPSQVKAWFLEIKCHKEGKDEAALAETLSAFRIAHPALSNLPFLKR